MLGIHMSAALVTHLPCYTCTAMSEARLAQVSIIEVEFCRPKPQQSRENWVLNTHLSHWHLTTWALLTIKVEKSTKLELVKRL
jgi:hypothetical protein